MNGYSFGDTVKNSISLIYTKILWNKARLVRLPIHVRNKKNIKFKNGFTCGVGNRINIGKNGKLLIGKNFVMGDYNQIEAIESVTIGDDVLLGSKIFIGDSCHGKYNGDNQSVPTEEPNKRVVTTQPIVIGDRVWIGNGAYILGGVHIGNNVIIGCCGGVFHDIESDCMVAGIPARVIKKYNYETCRWERTKG
jgi:lipopolysaccharide O-acetyltransferase